MQLEMIEFIVMRRKRSQNFHLASKRRVGRVVRLWSLQPGQAPSPSGMVYTRARPRNLFRTF